MATIREQTRLIDIEGKTYGDLKLIKLYHDTSKSKDTTANNMFGVFKCKCGRKRIININTVLYAKEGSNVLKCSHKIMNGNSYYAVEESFVTRFRGAYKRMINENVGSEWTGVNEFYDDMFLGFYATIKEAMRNDLKVIRFDRYDQDKPYSKDNFYWYYGAKIKQDTNKYDLFIDDKHFGSLYEVANVFNMDLSTLYRRYKKGIRGNDLIG